jgi:glycosyltransferase involved in cell wall biosynthesis
MIRTVFLASSNPVTGTGGASRVISAYYNFFSRLNASLVSDSRYDVRPIVFHDCAFNPGLRRYIPAIKTFVLPFRLLSASLRREYNAHKPILWWHSFGVVDVFILALVSLLVPARIAHIVATLHNPTFFDQPNSIRSKIYFFLVSLSKAKIHYLNSTYINPRLLVSPSRHQLLPSYISVNPLPDTLLDLLGSHVFSNSTSVKPYRHIFAMCQLIPGKQVDHLIRAFAFLNSDWSLSIAGQGSEQEKLIDLCSQLNISDRVEFLGFIGDTQKNTIFSRSSVFCVPSISDTQSIVNIEAIAHGLPLVLYPYGPFLALYSKCPSVFFAASFSPSALAASIQKAEICTSGDLKRSQMQILSDFGDEAIVDNFGRDLFSLPR